MPQMLTDSSDKNAHIRSLIWKLTETISLWQFIMSYGSCYIHSWNCLRRRSMVITTENFMRASIMSQFGSNMDLFFNANHQERRVRKKKKKKKDCSK